MSTDFDNPLPNETSDAVVMTPPENEAADWNERAETDCGYRDAEAVGQLPGEMIVPPERVEEDKRLLQRQRW